MKQLIGSDIGSYAFDPLTQTITLAGLPEITLANVLVITNVTAGVMLYNFADSTLGGSLSGAALTLETSTTGQNASDVLQIWVDLPSGDVAQETTLGAIAGYLLRIWNQLTDPPGFDMTQNRHRATVAVESGTVTTVTTCSTVSNVAAQGGTQAQLLALAADEQAWHALVRTKIS